MPQRLLGQEDVNRSGREAPRSAELDRRYLARGRKRIDMIRLTPQGLCDLLCGERIKSRGIFRHVYSPHSLRVVSIMRSATSIILALFLGMPIGRTLGRFPGEPRCAVQIDLFLNGRISDYARPHHVRACQCRVPAEKSTPPFPFIHAQSPNP